MKTNKKYSKLLKEILVDKNWEEDLDIIKILVDKGAKIEVKDHPKFLKMDTEKFKKIINFFEHDGKDEIIFFDIINLTDDQKNNPTIAENYSFYFSNVKNIILKKIEIYPGITPKDSPIFRNIFNFLVEEGNGLLLKKILEKGLIKKEDFSDNDLIDSIRRSFILGSRKSREVNFNSVLLLKSHGIIDDDLLSKAFISSLNHSFFIRNRNDRQSVGDRLLSEYVFSINSELSDLETLGILNKFKEKTEEVESCFKNLEQSVEKIVQIRKDLFKTLIQGDNIYNDLLEDSTKTIEEIIYFEKHKNKYGLKNEISFNSIVNMYKELVEDFSKNDKVKKSFLSLEKEKKYNETLIKLNQVLMENDLINDKKNVKKIKV